MWYFNQRMSLRELQLFNNIDISGNQQTVWACYWRWRECCKCDGYKWDDRGGCDEQDTGACKLNS